METLYSAMPYALSATFVLIGISLAVRFVVGWISNAPEQRDILSEPHRNLAREEDMTFQEEVLCQVCGDLATHPKPQLIRQRTSFLQAFFAMAPRYKRVVPKPAGPVEYFLHLVTLGATTLSREPASELCVTHAHVADAMMDQFLYTDIRAAQSRTNEQIAIKAAEFESEKLIDKLRESLTEEQKKKRIRRSQAPRQLRAVANGN